MDRRPTDDSIEPVLGEDSAIGDEGESQGSELTRAWQARAWQGIPGLVHRFFGRVGGVSRGPWASLNLSPWVGDNAADVNANWKVAQRTLPGLAGVVTMRQVHGATVARVDNPVSAVDGVDGLFTNASGLGLGVLTADCVPILMVAAQHRVAVAVHAGWRGTLAGIVRVALHKARDELGLEPTAFQVALGPAIGGCCYEVGADIGQSIEQRWGPLGDGWRPQGEKGRLDLREVNRRMLLGMGVPEAAIELVGPCTACHLRSFFSHRGAAGTTGRQLSIVGWQE